MTVTDEIRTLIDGLAKALPSDSWDRQHQIDEIFAGMEFVLSRPTYAKWTEIRSCDSTASVYDGTEDVYLFAKHRPWDARLDDIVSEEDEDGVKYAGIVMVRHVRPGSGPNLRRGEVMLMPVQDAMQLKMQRECRWATQCEIERAVEESNRKASTPEGGGRAAGLLRSVAVANRLHSLPSAAPTGRRKVSNKDSSRAPRAIATKR